MSFRRRTVILAMASIVAFPASRALGQSTSGSTLKWQRSNTDPRWVQGRVTVPTPGDSIWGRLQQVDRWKDMFTDIKSLRVLEHDGNRWRINLRTTAFDCGAHDYDVRFDDAQTAHLRINAPGADAHALISVKPAPRADESVVTYSLFVQATGIVSWFVSEETLRKKQEYMVTKYLTDLQRAFSPAAAVVGQAAAL